MKFTYTHENGVEAQWHGGAYIELGLIAQRDSTIRNDKGQSSHDAGDFVCLEVINVWNVSSDTPRIERTQEAFEERVNDWFESEDNSDWERNFSEQSLGAGL